MSAFESLLYKVPAVLAAMPEASQYDVAATSWSALLSALQYSPIVLEVGRGAGGVLEGIAKRIERGASSPMAAGTLRVRLDAEQRQLAVGVPADEAGVLSAVLSRCASVLAPFELDSELDSSSSDDAWALEPIALDAAWALDAVVRASEERGTPLRLRVVDGCRGYVNQENKVERLDAVLQRPAVQRHLHELRWFDWNRDDNPFGANARWVWALGNLQVLHVDTGATHSLRTGAADALRSGVLALAAAIRDRTCKLRELKVSVGDRFLLEDLCDALGRNRTLESLSLDGFSPTGVIDPDSIYAYHGDTDDSASDSGDAPAIEEHPLQTLLRTTTTLRKLHLRDWHNTSSLYNFSEDEQIELKDGYRELFSALGAGLACNTSLQELKLGLSHWDDILLYDDPSCIRGLFDGLSQNTSLRVLDILPPIEGAYTHNHEFPPDMLGELARALKTCGLEQVRMQVNYHDGTFGVVADMLASTSCIQELHLSWSGGGPVPGAEMNDDGSHKLARAIREGALGRTLRMLKLSHSDDFPGESLFEALSGSTTLQSLEIDVPGGAGALTVHLGRLLERSQSLRRLRVWRACSSLEPRSADLIAAGLLKNTVLEHLELHDIYTEGWAIPLAHALGPESALRCLRIVEPYRALARSGPSRTEATPQQKEEAIGIATAFAGAFDRGAALRLLDVGSVAAFTADAGKILLAAASRRTSPEVCEIRVSMNAQEGQALAAWCKTEVDARRVRFKPRLSSGATA
ncbi:unnamed protein product [Pedinophyceae sp. YPF-701]|nr:unnamed protein product [Pedinophyceae sp. YPF-701]